MQVIDENLAILQFPFKMLGIEIGRTVTLVRMSSGDVVIHSTAPFSPDDVERIRNFGRPVAMVEATRFHDTFASAALSAFPDTPYFVPDGFPAPSDAMCRSLSEALGRWAPELTVFPLKGMPRVQEHVFFHAPSRTLIMADFLFNFSPRTRLSTRCFFRCAGGIRRYPGTSRIFRFMIRDRRAFEASVGALLELDFNRIIVGHGEPIEREGKAELGAALMRGGLLPG